MIHANLSALSFLAATASPLVSPQTGAAPHINWLAVAVAAIASFVLGGIWYSPLLFGRAWMRLTGLSEAQLAAGNPAIIYGVSFVLSLMASAVFALFLGPAPAIGLALGAGASAGFCWV